MATMTATMGAAAAASVIHSFMPASYVLSSPEARAGASADPELYATECDVFVVAILVEEEAHFEAGARRGRQTLRLEVRRVRRRRHSRRQRALRGVPDQADDVVVAAV